MVDSIDEPPQSLWLDTSEKSTHPALSGTLDIDVAVIGGGITGLSTALELLERGYEVALLEADHIGSGASGYTTAKLTSQHGLCYRHLAETFGRETARLYGQVHERAIGFVEKRITDMEREVAFERTPAYVYSTDAADVDRLEREAQLAASLGLPAAYITSVGPVAVQAAVRFDEQAQFHPYQYLVGLAESVDQHGGHIFEHTRAKRLQTGRPHRIHTTRGVVTANAVVVATRFPFSDRGGYFARLHPRRAYLLAVRIADALPTGMYYSMDEPPVTFRPYSDDDQRLLIVGGQAHSPGEPGPSTSERYHRCMTFAREQFDVEDVVYRWSTHDYTTVDGLPYIGQLGPLHDTVYVATGFGGWGLTTGVIASRLIAALHDDEHHPAAEIFDPQRVSLGVSIRPLVKENVDVGRRFVGDRLRSWLDSRSLPPRGEGAIIRRRGRPIAVARDDDGELHAVSAVCPHLWCLVSWNDAERTWDCPCHGSRFAVDGSVRSGPAVDDLPRRSI